MRYGCYYPDPGLSVASTVGDFIIIGFPELFHAGQAGVSSWPAGTWQQVRDRRLDILSGPPSFGSAQDTFLNTGGALDTELRMMRLTCDHFGLAYPLAILLDEEWGNKIQAALQGHGPLVHWPLVHAYLAERKAMGADVEQTYVTLATHICRALERAAMVCKQVFPGVPVGHVEPWWEDDPGQGWHYHPVPKTYDFLGVDAYCPGPEITRERWDRYVGRCYEASARYGKPLLMVPQCFRDGGVWSVIPTPAQLGWWAELPSRYDIRASAPFLLHHPGKYDRRHPDHTTGLDLMDAPEHLRALQGYVAAQHGMAGRSNWAQAGAARWFEVG